MVSGSEKGLPPLELTTEDEDEDMGSVPPSITRTQARTSHASVGRPPLRRSACHVWNHR